MVLVLKLHLLWDLKLKQPHFISYVSQLAISFSFQDLFFKSILPPLVFHLFLVDHWLILFLDLLTSRCFCLFVFLWLVSVKASPAVDEALMTCHCQGLLLLLRLLLLLPLVCEVGCTAHVHDSRPSS